MYHLRSCIKTNQLIHTADMDTSDIAVRGALGVIALSAALGTHSVMAQSAQNTTTQHEGAQSSETQQFDTITVTGEVSVEQTPWVTETTRRELDALQVTDLNELGARIDPGVNYNTTSKSVNIRGLEGTRVVTRIDGIRQPYITEIRGDVKGGANAFDFASLSAVDVVRGTDSTAVGSGALGGVLDVRTLRPYDLINPERGYGVIGKTGYYSVDNSWTLNGAVAAETDFGLRWLFQAGVRSGDAMQNAGKVGGYGTKRSEVNPSNYTQQSYLLRAEQSFDGGHELGLSASYFDRSEDENQLNQSPTTYTPGRNMLDSKLKRQSVALDYGWVSPREGMLIDAFNAKIWWQKVESSETQDAWRLTTPIGDFYRQNKVEESMYGLSFDMNKAFRGPVSQFWEFGLEYYGTELKQQQIGRDSCPANSPPFSTCGFFHNNQADLPTVDGKNLGVWLQNTVGFFDDRLTITPAIRFDDYSYSPKTNANFNSNPVFTSLSSRSGQAWSPKVLVSWKATQDLTLYGQYSKGFNAPTPTQLYSQFGAPGLYLRNGNPDLKDERSHGWEFGAKYAAKTYSASITWFDTSYSNFIEEAASTWDPRYPLGVFSYENRADVRIYGIEARGDWTFSPGWNVYGSLAWTEGKDRHLNQYLNSVAPLRGILGLSYEAEQWGARAQMTMAAARTKVQDPTTNFKAPGYGIVDLTAYWKPAAVKGLTLQAGLFNVFNKTYWNALDVPDTVSARPTSVSSVDYYTQPGRNFSLSLTYQY